MLNYSCDLAKQMHTSLREQHVRKCPHVRINMAINTIYVTLVKKATIVARGTLLTLVDQEDRGNPTNIGRVGKFAVNPIPYDRNKYVPKHVGYIYIYMQGVPGGMCQTSGGCSLG